jgi:hypothetical protein
MFRAGVIAAVFAIVGFTAAHLVLAHAAGAGPPRAEVRLTALMAGLFGGGTAAVVAGVVIAMGRRNRP